MGYVQPESAGRHLPEQFQLIKFFIEQPFIFELVEQQLFQFKFQLLRSRVKGREDRTGNGECG